MKRILAKYLLYITLFPVKTVMSMIPRNRSIWVFGAWFGQRYADNPKYLFEYVRSTQKVRAIWITKSPVVHVQLTAKGIECYSAYSLKGIWVQLRAGIALINIDLTDLSPLLVSGAKIIQLWHGSPLKKIGRDDERFANPKNKLIAPLWALRNFFLRNEWHSYKLFPAPSEEIARLFQRAFELQPEITPILGFPRNDAFSDKFALSNTRTQLLNNTDLPKSIKIILYLPTHRKEGRGDNVLLPFNDLELDRLSDWLFENNAALIYKAHFYHAQKTTQTRSNNRIVDISHADYDVQLLLGIADILVTDFSSAYFDFLLTEKPIVFISSDIHEYTTAERGLYFDYDEVTPGYKVVNQEQFLSAIESYFGDPEIHHDERVKISRRFNSVKSGDASANVFNFISTMIYH